MNSPSSASAAGQRLNHALAKAELLKTIAQTIGILAVPGQVVELRIPGLKGKQTDSGYFNDPAKLAQAVLTYDGRAEGIYITLNPITPALLARSSNRVQTYAKHTTADKDVLHRRWIFVDFDPVRPAGISASDPEHRAALDRATACQEWLDGQQISSVLANSGNGAHLLIPVDLPNDEASAALVKGVLAVIDLKFSDTQVQVDTSTASAGHLVKLYGTLACKGDSVAERPHRRSTILAAPDPIVAVSRARLETLILTAPQPTHEDAKPSNPDRGILDDLKARFDLLAYAEQHLGVTAVKQGQEYRLPGNAGFIVNPDKGCWYHHGGQAGGDALDLVGHFCFGSGWNKHDAEQFKQVLREAADFCGVTLPQPNSRKSVHSLEGANTLNDASKESATKADLLDVAQAWHQQYAADLAWDACAQTWRWWMGTHWQAEREPESLDLLTAHLMRDLGVAVSSAHKTDGVIRFARALCKRGFDLNTTLINFQNGTLDLTTLTLRNHERADALTGCIPYAYTPDIDYPRIAKFLRETIPDVEGQRAYMTHLGAALLHDTTLHKALVIIGPTRSGKTTLLKLAQLALGYRPGQFATSLLFSAESRGANSRATWIDHTPRLVCLDEFPEEAIRDEGEELFKSMTAHGGVSMWLKYRDERSENVWLPKLMFATNNRMRYRDQSGALTRRLVVIECPNALPDHQLDGDLLRKLAPELGAFAAACITLALDAQRNRSYPASDAMRQLLADIETNGDAVKLWLTENCIFDPTAFTSTHALYGNFRLWCGENGLFPVSRPKLRDTILGCRAGIVSTKRRVLDPTTDQMKPMWGLVGIRLRKDTDPDDDLDDTRSTVPESPEHKRGQESSDTAQRSDVPSLSENFSVNELSHPPSADSDQEKLNGNSWNTGTDPTVTQKLPDLPNGTLTEQRHHSHQPDPETEQKQRQPCRPCYACTCDNWWQNSTGQWICAMCHPRPTG